VAKPAISYKKITIAYAAWWLFWIALQFFLLTKIGFDWADALIDSIVTQLVFALAGYTINTSMRSYQPSVRNSFYVLSWSIALAILCFIVQRWLLFEINGDAYSDFVQKSMVVREAFGWLMILLIAVLTWFWVYVSDRAESEKRKDDAAKLARDAELSNLRLQLQPHFLFNSLNSISALAGTRPEEARKMIQQLSDFLRGTIKKDDSSLLTLEEELHHLQLYLDIEKVRFGHRLNTVVEKSDDSIVLKLPSLLLQPIVENAIKFGLYDTIGEITITISAWKEKNDLFIVVKNPFDPSTSIPKRGTGFGLSSVQRRLYLIYFRNDLLETKQEENIFTTTIKIPQSV
jgi:two-component system, LytTR family, sensor kinase